MLDGFNFTGYKKYNLNLNYFFETKFKERCYNLKDTIRVKVSSARAQWTSIIIDYVLYCIPLSRFARRVMKYGNKSKGSKV